MASTVRRTPWFPDDDGQSSPSVVFTGQRVSAPLFSPVRHRPPRDADHYEMEPRSKPLDPIDLQDDSFVTFSVGNLDRRNFSVLGMSHLVRAMSRPEQQPSPDSSMRVRHHTFPVWRRRSRKSRDREKDREMECDKDPEKLVDVSERETESSTQRDRERAADLLFAPVRRCFYY